MSCSSQIPGMKKPAVEAGFFLPASPSTATWEQILVKQPFLTLKSQPTPKPQIPSAATAV